MATAQSTVTTPPQFPIHPVEPGVMALMVTSEPSHAYAGIPPMVLNRIVEIAYDGPHRLETPEGMTDALFFGPSMKTDTRIIVDCVPSCNPVQHCS